MIYYGKIPDHYYEFGTPYITDYMDKKGVGLAYYLSPEEAYELSAAHGSDESVVVISLLSPYIWGFDFPLKAYELELVSVNIKDRTVSVRKILQ